MTLSACFPDDLASNLPAADRRDTAWFGMVTTRMTFGGTPIPQTISVTGHTAESAHTILKHYQARHRELADAAIGKMVQWFEPSENA